jgi:GTPase
VLFFKHFIENIMIHKIEKNLPRVSLVGRVNVGKSTLFNKLTESKKALVSEIPGATRDLNFGVCDWEGKSFEVVDTGGIFEIKTKNIKSKKHDLQDSIEFQTEKKAREALKNSDLVLFILDTHDGIMESDRQILNFLRKEKVNFLSVANKCDSSKHIARTEEFQKLGIKDIQIISAASGKGVGDMLDEVLKKVKCPPTPEEEPRADEPILNENEETKVVIVGRPNVGKSSLLNQIVGEEMAIVSPVAHTTREPQDIELKINGKKVTLIDTAGIRRKNKVKRESLESLGIGMSIYTLKKADIALFVLDVSEELTAQDAQLAGLIIESGVSLIFVANKYDLIEDIDKNTTKDLTTHIHRFFPFLTWAPAIFVSAKTGRSTQKVLSLAMDIKKKRQQLLDQEEMYQFIRGLIRKMPPPRQPRKRGSDKKSRAFITKVTQKDNNPPVFDMHLINNIEIPESYLNYIKNSFREKFHYSGTPLKFVITREGPKNKKSLEE